MDKRPLPIRFGELIRRLRQKAELSQEELAGVCEIHRTYVGFIERGEKTVTIETANTLALALGLTLSELFRELEIADKG
jgi:transcriptional regulator with XRE-family HTH domain